MEAARLHSAFVAYHTALHTDFGEEKSEDVTLLNLNKKDDENGVL